MKKIASIILVLCLILSLTSFVAAENYNSIKDPDKLVGGSTPSPKPTATAAPAPTSTPEPPAETASPNPSPDSDDESEAEIIPPSLPDSEDEVFIMGAWLDLSDPDLMLPVEIVQSENRYEIRKIYELLEDEVPGCIPTDSFIRDNVLYSCTDVLRKAVSEDESKEISDTVTVNSKSNDMPTVLSLLPKTKDIDTEDGFTGVLSLDMDSIKTEVAGYGSSSRTVTATRTYPNLSDADSASIPKTTTESGSNLQLSDVQWQTSAVEGAEGYEERYTATATYSGTASSSYVSGYNTTAEYRGEVSRTNTDCIRYTVIFTGAEIPEPSPEPTPEPTPAPTPEPEPEPEPEIETTRIMIIGICAALIIIALIGGATYARSQKKKKNRKEKQDD